MRILFSSFLMLAILISCDSPQVLQKEIAIISDLYFLEKNSNEDRYFMEVHTDGTYFASLFDKEGIQWLDRGCWKRLKNNDFILYSEREAKDIVVGRIHVCIHLEDNLPLLLKLKNKISNVLSKDPLKKQFSDQEILDIDVRGKECPKNDSYICAGGCQGPWVYLVSLSPDTEFDDPPISRKELIKVIPAIDGYLKSNDKNKIRMRLLQYKGCTVPVFFDNSVLFHDIWDTGDVVMAINDHESGIFLFSGSFPFLIEVTCEEYNMEAAKVGNFPCR